MVQITRGSGPSGRSQLGRVQSAASVSTAGSGVGAVTEKLGGVIGAIGSEYMQKAQQGLSTAVYDNAMGAATKEFNEGYQARSRVTVDENGQPIMGRLAADTQEIGDSVLKNNANIILDPMAKQQFSRDFNNFVGRSVIKASAVGRSQELDHIKAQSEKSVAEYTANLPAVPFSELKSSLAEQTKKLTSYFNSGAMSEVEYGRKVRNLKRNTYVSKYSELIQTNPEQVLAVLSGKMSPEVLGMEETNVSPTDEIQLRDAAEAKIVANDIKAVRAAKIADKQVYDTQNFIYQEALKDARAGLLDESDVIRIKDTLNPDGTPVMTEEMEIKLSGEIRRINFRASTKLNVQTGVSEALSSPNGSTRDFSAAQVNTHYEDTVNGQGGMNGTTLEQRARLTAPYDRPISQYTKDLESRATTGSPADMVEGLKAWKYSLDTNPIVISKMSGDATKIYAAAYSLMEDTSMSDEEARRISRESVNDKSKDTVIERAEKFKAMTGFKLGDDSNLKNIINNSIGNTFNRSLAPGTEAKSASLLKTLALTMDGEGPIEVAFAALTKQTLGNTILNGTEDHLFRPATGQAMYFAPETMYPKANVELLKEDLDNTIYLAAPKAEGSSKVYFASDSLTRSVEGVNSYGLFYVDSRGIEQPLKTQVVTPDARGDMYPMIVTEGTDARWYLSEQSIAANEQPMKDAKKAGAVLDREYAVAQGQYKERLKDISASDSLMDILDDAPTRGTTPQEKAAEKAKSEAKKNADAARIRFLSGKDAYIKD
jgi:hypothetical protein